MIDIGKNAPLFEVGVVLFDIMDVMWRTGRCPQQGTLDWWREQQ